MLSKVRREMRECVTVIIDGCKSGCDILWHHCGHGAICVNPYFECCCCASCIWVSCHDNNADFLDELLRLKVGNQELIRVSNNRILEDLHFTRLRDVIESVLHVVELVHVLLNVHHELALHDKEVSWELDDDVVPVRQCHCRREF